MEVKTPCCYGFKRFCGWTISKEKRTLHLKGRRVPSSFPTNKLNNQKYNILTFIPKVLYNEFKFFFNMFFLLIALSQFIPFLKVGFMFTFIAPLVFVLIVSMGKEAYDDIKRMQRDRDLNNTKYKVLKNNGNFEDKSSQNLKVGNIIRVD